MKKTLFLHFSVMFITATLLFPYSASASGAAVAFKTVEEKVIKADDRCTKCHGEGKEEPSLNYKWVKNSLKSMTEEEIKENAWFPVTYCDGPLDDVRIETILKWVKAGMTE